MIPLFKTHASIGKSLLTLNPPNEEGDGSDSVFSIAKEHDLKTLWLVEDSMVGFFNAFKKCEAMGIQLIFGYRFICCNDVSNNESNHKLIAFAKNDDGCRDLNRFYSHINTKCSGRITNNDLHKFFTPNMLLAVPFYDSFIYNNQLHLGNCIPDLNGLDPIFFIEKNNLPFDQLITDEVNRFTTNRYKTQLVKSIYYKNKDDVEALQTYKIVCNRTFGKQASLSSPNLNHFGSDEFCWESYLEHEK